MDTQPQPSSQPGSPEHGGGSLPEQLAAPVDQTPAMPQSAPAAPPAAAPLQVPGSVPASVPAAPVAGGGVAGPSVANDVDVIEPEWVDKAEQVVRERAGDPYAEEEAIEDLQQDYLKKRYGYSVGDPKQDTTKSEDA
jgi:hypothetical protein